MEQLVLLIDELEKLQRALPANLRDTKTLQDSSRGAQYAQDHDYESSSCNENVAYYTNRIYKGGRD
ncbi:hypothetical protein GcM1_138003, partial [Golovinomyces cichoracearum]